MLESAQIKQALQTIPDVGGGGDIVAAQRVANIEIKGDVVKLTLMLPAENAGEIERIEDACFDAVSAIAGVKDVTVVTRKAPGSPQRQPGPPRTGDPFDSQAPIPGVKHIIAVASGKGGVGKSTVCVNLALALSARGARVGLMDSDVYGPSLHILLGVDGRPRRGHTKELSPLEKHGVKLMSLGFLTDDSSPVIWRGPIVTGVVKKLLQDVDWGELDYLMIDLPPGTGDVQLTLAQTVPITGAIIVTTPSELSLVDAEKGLRMFEQVHVPVFGIVENMSTFVCPHCGEETAIFDSGGGAKISSRTSTDVIGRIPLHPDVRAGGDTGRPIVVADRNSPITGAFFSIADKILERYPKA
ncbi:MAG: Mrp/NBP35 family ATP-binding protein [bacterium]|nr:Mrp/NBP35 family ATP-binding protein [bacterium]